jgi:hypothetical protein
MAVQAPFYPENMDFPMCGLQDPAFGFVDDLRFSLQYPQQTLFHPQRSAQKLGVDYNEGVSSASSCNSFPPMPVFQSLDALFELQSQEIDRILLIQVIIIYHNLIWVFFKSILWASKMFIYYGFSSFVV